MASDTTTPPKNPPARLLVRERDLPAMLGMSRAYVRQLLAAGRFPAALRIGKHCVAWRVADLEAWIAGGCGAVEPGGEV